MCPWLFILKRTFRIEIEFKYITRDTMTNVWYALFTLEENICIEIKFEIYNCIQYKIVCYDYLTLEENICIEIEFGYIVSWGNVKCLIWLFTLRREHWHWNWQFTIYEYLYPTCYRVNTFTHKDNQLYVQFVKQ